MLQPLIASPRCTVAASALYGAAQQWGMVARQRNLGRNFIRAWREAAGLSLDELAAQVRMDKGNLSKVERGINPYHQTMLEKIAAALRCEPADLIQREGPGAPESIYAVAARANERVKRQLALIAETLIREDETPQK